MTRTRQSRRSGRGPTGPRAPHAAPTVRARWAVVPVAALAVLVHLNTLGNGFALDDEGIILNNPRLHSLTQLADIWLAPYWPYLGVELGLWRPLSSFGYALQWAFGGGSPLLFHMVSIGLHAAVVVVVFQLLQRLAGAPAAFAGAVIFAVHPVHTEAVANVVGQAELIAALAVLLACRRHASAPDEAVAGTRNSVVLAALFIAGLLAKEHAVVLPPLLVLVDAALGRVQGGWRGIAVYARRMARPATALAVVLTLYLAVRLLVLQGHMFGIEPGPQVGYLKTGNRVFVALQAFPEYMRLLLGPASLSADYSPGMFAPAVSATAAVVAGGAIVALLLALALATPVRPRIGFPAAWFLITILPVSNLVFPTGVFVAERTLYLPSFALSALVAFATAALLPKLGAAGMRVGTAALLFVALLGGIRTWQRNPDWRSTDAILDALVRDHPSSYRAQLRLAGLAVEAGRPDAARRHYEAALSTWADDSELLNEYGNFLLARGETDAAIPHFERSLQLHPFISRTTVFLGTAYLEVGRFEETLLLAEQARARGFSIAVHAPLAAAALDGLGQPQEARRAWQETIARANLAPPILWAFLARTLARRDAGDLALEAVARGRSATGQDPGTTRLMAAVENAVRQGCYRGSPAEEAQCDPIAEWLRGMPGTYGSWFSPLDRPVRRTPTMPVRPSDQ
jgi:protein O-mannosyl-transferase